MITSNQKTENTQSDLQGLDKALFVAVVVGLLLVILGLVACGGAL